MFVYSVNQSSEINLIYSRKHHFIIQVFCLWVLLIPNPQGAVSQDAIGAVTVSIMTLNIMALNRLNPGTSITSL
jgi:hypothetical protein